MENSQYDLKILPRFQSFEENTLYEGGVCLAEMISLSVRGDQLPLICFLLLSQVHVKVSVPRGVKFVGHPGRHQLTRKRCVAPGEAASTAIVLSFTELGSANITGNHQVQLKVAPRVNIVLEQREKTSLQPFMLIVFLL